jgi:hypothetical protein
MPEGERKKRHPVMLSPVQHQLVLDRQASGGLSYSATVGGMIEQAAVPFPADAVWKSIHEYRCEETECDGRCQLITESVAAAVRLAQR